MYIYIYPGNHLLDNILKVEMKQEIFSIAPLYLQFFSISPLEFYNNLYLLYVLLLDCVLFLFIFIFAFLLLMST